MSALWNKSISGANLFAVYLTGEHFGSVGTDFRDADLSDAAHLNGTTLDGADLTGARLDGAYLQALT
jgi:uncharacterized protein YjbI with pentapeptide repeats